MYTVLLATDRPDIQGAFARYAGWASMGFEMPWITNSAEEAMARIQQTPPDAVSIELPKEQSAKLYDLLQAYPHIFYLKAVADPQALPAVLADLSTMLEGSNETGSATQSLLPELRAEFFMMLLDGMIANEQVLHHRLGALQLPFGVSTPCLLLTLDLPDEERYLREVWRYGRARLAAALLKFFEASDPSVHFAMGSFTPQGIRLLAVPVGPSGLEGVEVPIRESVGRALDDIGEYLGLTVALMQMEVLEGLDHLLVK